MRAMTVQYSQSDKTVCIYTSCHGHTKVSEEYSEGGRRVCVVGETARCASVEEVVLFSE